MLPRSLGGRLAAAFAILALAIVVVVGAAVFVTLRDLNREKTETRLADLGDGLVTQLRENIADGQLRGTVVTYAARLGGQGIETYTATADGQLRGLDGAVIDGPPVQLGVARGDTRRGEIELAGLRLLYASTVVRQRSTGVLPQAVVFATPDRSGSDALGDVGRAIPAVIIVVLLVGVPLGWLVRRSVTQPLRRLAAATAELAAGRTEPLPLEGPVEVQDLTRAFNAMAAELDLTRRHEADLLANLRHDLRTPLTVIGGFAAALADGTASGADAERAAHVIGEEAERLERLVAELGAIERLRSGSDGLHPEPLDAGQLLVATVERFAARAAAGGVELAIVGTDPAAETALAADRLAAERILANLVENALAAAPSPGGHIWLEARATTAGPGDDRPAVALSVTDDGAGFPPGAAQRAFERFFRADPSRSGGGSGLGLAIVDELARAHGGSAHAENVAPRGARVSVILPRVPPPSGVADA